MGNNQPVRVLFVHCNSRLRSGSDFSLFYLIKHLDRSKITPHILLPEAHDDVVAAYAAEGVKVTAVAMPMLSNTLSPIANLSYLLNLAISSWRLYPFIKREGIQLVHLNSLHSIPGAIAARLAGIPVVWHIREIVAVGPKMVRKLLASVVKSFAGRIVVVSDAVARDMLNLVPGTAKTVTVYNGVDIEAFSQPTEDAAGTFRAELGVTDGQFLVGVLSRITYWKGHEVFIRAASKVIKSCPKVRFVIVGAADPGREDVLEDLYQLVRQFELEQTVFFVGFRQDIPRVLTSLDVVVNCSTLPDPFPRTVIEGMAVGKPVIGSACGGIPEAIVNGETGIIVPPGDEKALANAISFLASDPACARRMGENGARRVRERFTVETHASQMEALLLQSIPAKARKTQVNK